MKQIPLTKGQFALVDDEDYQRVIQHKWSASRSINGNVFYAKTRLKEGRGLQNRIVAMHRIILGVTDPNIHVDHINGIGTDNRRSNLRLCSRSENGANRSATRVSSTGYKGVYCYNAKYGWVARIVHEGSSVYIGTFPTPEDAARAYNEAALRYHGEFARLNEIP